MVYVDYLTACGGTTNLGTVDFRVRGAYANSRLGTSIAGGPIDPGTDAYDDLLVGAYRSYDLPGTSYAYWVPGRASGGPSSRPAAA
jgi:hypothetical protein